MTTPEEQLARLEEEIKLVRAMIPLETAREAMHKNRNATTIKAYQKAAKKASKVRVAFREKYPPVADPGGGVAAPATVHVKARRG